MQTKKKGNFIASEIYNYILLSDNFLKVHKHKICFFHKPYSYGPKGL